MKRVILPSINRYIASRSRRGVGVATTGTSTRNITMTPAIASSSQLRHIITTATNLSPLVTSYLVADSSTTTTTLRIPAVATLSTMECDDELLLFLTSLRTHHPLIDSTSTTTPPLDIYIACTSEILGVGGKSSSRSRAYRAFCNDPHIHWLPFLDRFTSPATSNSTPSANSRVQTPILGRSIMEHTAGTGFYRTQHEEFMMEKSTIMEYVLLQQQLKVKRGGCGSGVGVVFLDCDITTLSPLPELISTTSAQSSSSQNPNICPPLLAVSRHYISQRDELMFGTYNGGMVYMSDPSLLSIWRRCTMDPFNRFFDQSSLEGVVDEVVGADGGASNASSSKVPFCQLFPLQSNFGYWRLLQQGLDGQPLASIPTTATHAPDSSSLSRRHARMLAKYGHNGASLAHMASSQQHQQDEPSIDAATQDDLDTYGEVGEAHLFSLNSVLKRFSLQVPSGGCHALVHFDDTPLQSVHTHLLVTPVMPGGTSASNNSKMILFNRFIIGMMRRAVAADVQVWDGGHCDTKPTPHPYASLLDIIIDNNSP